MTHHEKVERLRALLAYPRVKMDDAVREEVDRLLSEVDVAFRHPELGILQNGNGCVICHLIARTKQETALEPIGGWLYGLRVGSQLTNEASARLYANACEEHKRDAAEAVGDRVATWIDEQ